MGLLPPTASVSGRIAFEGVDVLERGEQTIAPHRWKDIAMVFQGAMNAFDPVKRIGEQIVEPMELHGTATGKEAAARVARAARDGRDPARAGEELSARALRGDAPARRDRDGARLQPAHPARGRADHRARRDGAGADPSAPDATCRTSSGSRSCSSRTTCRSSPRRARMPLSCTPARSSSRARPMRSTTRRGIPIRGCSGRRRPTSSPHDEVVSIPGVPPRLDVEIHGCPFAPRCDRAEARCVSERPELRTVGDGHTSACHFASSLEVVR